MTFDTNDILRQTGYSEGDVLPLSTITPATNAATSTTGDTYEDTFSSLQQGHDWRPFTEGAGTPLKVRASAQVTTNDDEIFIRVRDVDSGDTIVSPFSTTASFSAIASDGWEDYTPVSDTMRILGQIRNTDNASTVETRNITLYIGVEL